MSRSLLIFTQACLMVGLSWGPAQAVTSSHDGSVVPLALRPDAPATALPTIWQSGAELGQPCPQDIGGGCPVRSNPRHPIIASRTARGLWQGQGRIVQGAGKGGIVQLMLRFDGKRVWTVPGKGPALNQPTRTLFGATLRDRGRTWTFLQCGDRLCVSLQQKSPNQVVRYVLNN